MVDIEIAKLNPSSVYDSPSEVAEDQSLTIADKVEILRRWEYDAKEMQVATEENMPGKNSDILDKILDVLNNLEPDSKPSKRTSPTKQG